MNKNDDLYAILGVSKTADQGEIRAAYRRLAKQSHPDLHPGDKAAEDRFKSISAANDILGDEDKRKRYDKGEIDATGAESHPSGAYRQHADANGPHQYYSTSGFDDFTNVNDVFSDLFARQGGRQNGGFSMRGGDAQFTLGVEFLEAIQGTKKRITLPDGKHLEVTIPAGMNDGQILRLKGKGQPGLGDGGPGDALISISVRPHPQFKRRDNDVLVDLPISISEAVLGGRVEVPTVTGKVTISVPKGTSSGAVLRLKGKGVKTKTATGDQLVTLRIVLPNTMDDELVAFMTEWQASHAYDPRTAQKESA